MFSGLTVSKLNSYEGEVYNKVYPSYLIRSLLNEVKSIFSEICYSPIWNSEPVTLELWKVQKIQKSRLNWLYNNCEILLPKTHEDLNKLFIDPAPTIGLEKIAGLIINVREELYPHIIKNIGVRTKRELLNNQSLSDWLKRISSRPEIKLIESFMDEINIKKPIGLNSVLLHGSLADGLTINGFSDLDVHYIIKLPSDRKEMLELMSWIFQSNRYLLSYNPFMHHGPMVVLEEELLICSESILPTILIEKGIWIYGKIEEAYYTKDDFESINSFGVFKSLIEKRFTLSNDIKNIFEIIWWASTYLFLPLLYSQMKSKKSKWKRDVLENKINIPKEFWHFIELVGKVRNNIGRYVQKRIDLPLKINDNTQNPGLILKQYKEKTKLSDLEVQELGITNELLEKGREYYHFCVKEAFKLNEKNFHDKGYSWKNVRNNWIKDVCEIPTIINIKNYEIVKTEFIRRCSENNFVVAVYEFGTIGSPGLSDLDFLVILADDCQGIPEELTISKMDKSHAEIMNHDPLFICMSSVEFFGSIYPIFKATKIYGKDVNFKFTSDYSKNVQQCLYTF